MVEFIMREPNFPVLGFSEIKEVVNLRRKGRVTASKEDWRKKEEIPTLSLGKRGLMWK